MKKILPLSLFLAATALASTNAMAINVARTYTVAEGNGLGSGTTPVGRWNLLFLQELPPSGANFLGSCQYLVQWTNNANQGLSQQCTIDERKDLGHLSCMQNSRINFFTQITRAGQPRFATPFSWNPSHPVAPAFAPCGGWDRFQQAVTVNLMVLSELPSVGGIVASGVIQTTGASPALTSLIVRG